MIKCAAHLNDQQRTGLRLFEELQQRIPVLASSRGTLSVICLCLTYTPFLSVGRKRRVCVIEDSGRFDCVIEDSGRFDRVIEDSGRFDRNIEDSGRVSTVLLQAVGVFD